MADGTSTQYRQGVVEAWDPDTGDNTVRVAGGVLLNLPTLTGEAATLQVGDVVALLSAGDRWFVLGKVTTPGDPGTVPSWNADITALTGQVDTIQTVTIPAVQNDVTIVQGDVVELNMVTVPAVQATATAAQSAADAAQADATSALGKFPIAATDISDGAISTPKLAADAIDGMTITGALIRTAATGQRIEIDSPSASNQERFYSGVAGEVNPGIIESTASAGFGQLRLASPEFTSGVAELILQSHPTNITSLNATAGQVVVRATETSADVLLASDDGDIILSAWGEVKVGTARVAVSTNPVVVTDSTTMSALALTTTYAAGSTVCGTTFTAPKSGKVYITVGGRIQCETAGNHIYLSFEVRDSGIVGSGTVQTAADNTRAVACGANATGFTLIRVEASRRCLITGLTPGSTYNVRTMHACQSTTATGTIFNRDLLIEPVL